MVIVGGGSRLADPDGAAVDIWTEQARISRQLTAWAAASMTTGWVLALRGQVSGNRALRAFGTQNAAWGAADLAIAAFGEGRRRSRVAALPDPDDRLVQAAERRSLHRVLMVNAALDVGYIAGGLALLASSVAQLRPARAGHSAAVVLQGSFLLGFDVVHARRLAAPGPGA